MYKWWFTLSIWFTTTRVEQEQWLTMLHICIETSSKPCLRSHTQLIQILAQLWQKCIVNCNVFALTSMSKFEYMCNAAETDIQLFELWLIEFVRDLVQTYKVHVLSFLSPASDHCVLSSSSPSSLMRRGVFTAQRWPGFPQSGPWLYFKKPHMVIRVWYFMQVICHTLLRDNISPLSTALE